MVSACTYAARQVGFRSRDYTGSVGDWYTIGLCLGLGLGLGCALRAPRLERSGWARRRSSVRGRGGAIGLLVGDTAETVAGGVGGLLGALSAAVVVAARSGAARRASGAAYVGAVGLLVCLVALIPLAGYVVAVALPLLAARMRGRQAARYAGLRTLAK